MINVCISCSYYWWIGPNIFCQREKGYWTSNVFAPYDLNKDVNGTIEKMGKIGLNFLKQPALIMGNFYGMEPEAFKKLIEANGMKLISSHTGVDYTGDQASWMPQCSGGIRPLHS